MNNAHKIGNVICKLIRGIFVLMMFFIIVSTIFIDKRIDNSFLNTVAHSNWVYYAFSLVLGAIAVCFVCRISIPDRAYWLLLAAIAVGVAVWEYMVVCCIAENSGVDFRNIQAAAMGLAEGESFSEYPYFATSPNNANLAILLSYLYRIVPSWKAITLAGALCTDASAVLVSLSVRNYTQDNSAGVVSLVASCLLMAMTLRSFFVYTDNFGMLFISGGLYILSLNLERKIKIPLFLVVSAMGAYIKVTCALVVIAMLACYCLMELRESESMAGMIKRIGAALVLSAIVFVLLYTAQEALRARHGLEKGEYAKGWQYMLMVGQNTESYGTVNPEDSELRASFIEEYRDPQSVKDACRDEAFARIRSRGIMGNVKYVLAKLDVGYGDGYFNNVQMLSDDGSGWILRDVYQMDGKYYQVPANILQCLWMWVLAVFLVGSALTFRKRTPRSYLMEFYEMMVCGITLYLLCFEGRSKYIFMFLPIYLILFGVLLKEIGGEARRAFGRRGE